MEIHRKIFMGMLGGIILIGVIFMGWRGYALHRLPLDEVRIPPVVYGQKLEIPPRPGIQGIVITGPRREPLFFSVDISKAGIQSLNWQDLEALDPLADVKVNCFVDERGQLSFSQNDVRMGGHTEVGMRIQRALKTWMYKPFRTGMIQFWFNLPSKGRKLVIDTNGLRRKAGIPEDVPILFGQIHLVEGIPSNQVWIRGDF